VYFGGGSATGARTRRHRWKYQRHIMKSRTVLLLLLVIVYYAGIALVMISGVPGHAVSDTPNPLATTHAIN
jgi:hypothetical protein